MEVDGGSFESRRPQVVARQEQTSGGWWGSGTAAGLPAPNWLCQDLKVGASAGQVVARVVEEWVPGLTVGSGAVAPLTLREHSDVAALSPNRCLRPISRNDFD